MMTTSFSLDIFLRLIKEKTGLALEDINSREKLTNTIIERSSLLSLLSPFEYHNRLTSDSDEFQELINQLTINETYFFREPEQLNFVINTLIPPLLAKKPADMPLRILSAGCSSGEEPYSILMLLHQAYGDRAFTHFKVFGGDIDSNVLFKAKKGIYSDFSFRGVDDRLRQTYFTKNKQGNQLVDNIRTAVSFHELNLLTAKPTEDLQNFDIVFLRNVSIYFNQPERIIIQKNLAKIMTTDGHLIIGISETLSNDLGVLNMIENQGMFYFARQADSTTIKSTPSPTNAPPRKTTTTEEPTKAIQPLQSLAHQQPNSSKMTQLLFDKNYDAALPIAESLLIINPKDTMALLTKAYILLNKKQWLTAETLCKVILESDHWHIDAMMLLGFSAKWQGRASEASTWFKKIIYAKHEHWLAHYYMADSLKTGDTAQALRYYKSTLQWLNQSSQTASLSQLPLTLPESEVRFLCEHNIKKLSATIDRTGNT